MLSLDGADFASGDTTVKEVLQFSPELSDLPGGVLVWSGITRIPEQAVTPVFTRFYMTFTTDAGPMSLLDPASLGLDPRAELQDSARVHVPRLRVHEIRHRRRRFFGQPGARRTASSMSSQSTTS